jgi:hypothetical protein
MGHGFSEDFDSSTGTMAMSFKIPGITSGLKPAT